VEAKVAIDNRKFSGGADFPGNKTSTCSAHQSPPGLPIDFALASIIEANWSFSALIFMESNGF
jgi:hypothetical protein